MLLADIGNTRVHIFDGKNVLHLSHEEAIAGYHTVPLLYICVNQAVKSHIEYLALWEDISCCLSLKGEYATMGVDRKALCLSHTNGIFVDAGSAITVDIVKDGVYQGGFILPGIKAYLESYKTISPALDIELNRECSLSSLPLTTKDSVSYGIIASIKAVLDSHKTDLPLYFTGGDGEWLSSLFPDSKFDELLVFKGMQKALKDKSC
ncbi:MAG: type III pantothenate kinase [Campylobacterales bacterium]|nr:type III pantothenate kinase [Campylobacterales bacterium]